MIQILPVHFWSYSAHKKL